MQVTASVTVGAAKATVAGKTVPNELAGVPSFIGELSATDPLFDAMASAPMISLKVAKTAKDIPLKTMRQQGRGFQQGLPEILTVRPYSTLPIFFTAATSRALSSATNFENSGAS